MKLVDILYGQKEKTVAKINFLRKLSNFSLKIEIIRFLMSEICKTFELLVIERN